MTRTPSAHGARPAAARTDAGFLIALAAAGGLYLLLIAAMIVATARFTGPRDWLAALASPEIRYSLGLSLVSSTLAALLSMLVAVPLGYLLARTRFRGKALVDALVDVPLVLPPLVVGLSLLLLFQTPLGVAAQRIMPVTYEIPAVVLAQFAVAAALAVRVMRVTFERIDPGGEQIAQTLGASRRQAFFAVTLPQARAGVVSAAGLAWARSLGEFGPVLVFAGATRMKTEVLPTTIYLELSVGRIESAAAVSLLMVAAAIAVLLLLRRFGLEHPEA